MKLKISFDGNERDLANVLRLGLEVTELVSVGDGLFEVVADRKSVRPKTRVQDVCGTDVCKDFRGGMKVSDIAEKYCINKHTVYAVLDNAGIERGKRPQKKLAERNEKIRSEYAKGDTVDVLAERYGVTAHSIYMIIR